MEQTHARVIKELGGASHLAEVLGVSEVAASTWARPGRRIPAKFWHRIAALSEATQSRVTIDVLARLPPNPDASSEAA